MDLNSKQRAFIDEYLVDRNGAQAAVRAGYSSICARQTASRLLSHADIQAEIERRLEHLAFSHRVTRETVLAGLLRAIQIAEEDRNPSAAARAWAAVNKMLGFHEPARTELVLSTDGEKRRRQIEALPDEVLLEKIGGAMRDD